MGWVKLDELFAEHPKVEMAGDEAAWMYVSGLLYAYRADTDGFIPAAKVTKLTGFRSAKRIAQRLVDVGLWEPIEDGYLIHDYLKHQQSSETRAMKRKESAERVQKHRRNKKDVMPDVTPLQQGDKAVGNGEVTPQRGRDKAGTTTASGVPHPLDSSNVVDFAKVESAT